MSQKMPEFLTENDISWFPVKLQFRKVGEKEKKEPQYTDYYMPKCTDFQTLSKEEIIKRQELIDDYDYIAIDTNKIQQFDIDDKETLEEYKHLLKDNPYFLSVKKKLPHIFCKLDLDKLPKNGDGKPKNCHQVGKFDLLCGLWSYVHKDQLVYNPLSKINNFTNKFIDILQQEEPKKKQKEESKKKPKEEPKEELKDEPKEEPKEEPLEKDIKKVINKITKEKKQKIKEIKDEKEQKQQIKNHKNQINIIEKIINKDDNEFKELTEYLECLNKNRFEIYENWLKLATIVKQNYGEKSYPVFDSYCKKYKGYNKKDNIDIWDKCKSNDISLGTLLFWCKEDNFNKYSEIILNKYKDLQITDKFCCEILTLITDNIIWKNETLYVYDGQLWQSGTGAINKFKDIIDNELYDYINLHILSCYTKTSDISKLISQLRRITTQRGKDDIIKTSKQPQFKFNKDNDDIIFNKDWHFVPMKTKVYDLIEENFIDYRKDMYITTKLNYDYIEPKKEEEKNEFKKVYDEFDRLLNKIFPNPLIKEKFLMICSTGLENRLKQNVHIFTGVGGNGKSLLCNYLSVVLQQFYTLGDTQIITYGGKKDETKIANMASKRIIMFPEPDKLKKIDVGELKKYTGEKNINARKIYETKNDNINTGTYIICCNTLPLLSEAPDQAVKRRFDITPFVSLFTTDKTMIDSSKNIYEADITLEQKGETYKLAFFKMIIEAHKEYKKNSYCYKVIEECTNRTKNYYEKSNVLHTFFIEKYKLTDDENDKIFVKDIYENFRNDETYKLLTKEEKRIYNRTSIIEFIESNINYKTRYVQDRQATLIKIKQNYDYNDDIEN